MARFSSQGPRRDQATKARAKEGENILLNPQQEREIRNTIMDKTPDQLKLAGMLWTRKKVADYVKRKHGVTLSLQCVSNYLKRWGLSCQRPTKRAYAQDDVRVKQFKDHAISGHCKARKNRECRHILGRRNRRLQHRKLRARLCVEGKTAGSAGRNKAGALQYDLGDQQQGNCAFYDL